jgi:hypothetical protein
MAPCIACLASKHGKTKTKVPIQDVDSDLHTKAIPIQPMHILSILSFRHHLHSKLRLTLWLRVSLRVIRCGNSHSPDNFECDSTLREPCHFEWKSSYLEAIGPGEGRIPIEQIQSMLQKYHSLIKAHQKKVYLHDKNDAGSPYQVGFPKAIKFLDSLDAWWPLLVREFTLVV